MEARTFAIIISVVILLFVIESIRRQKMTFKYSIFWLALGISVIILAINHHWLVKASVVFGFELPSNFVFFLLLVFFIFLSLLLTIYINEQNIRSERLAQVVGILEYQIKELKKQTSNENKSG